MNVIHFFENNTKVISKLLKNIPSVDEDIKIKGRKGKVIRVNEIQENHFHVYVVFEQIIKKQAIVKDDKKKKR